MRPLVDLWSSYLKTAAETSQKMFEQVNGTADPEVWRRRWLDAISQSLEAYMRTPAFLSAMKHNMDAAIQAKAHANDFTKEVARNSGVPTLSDVSGVFERLHSIEESVISRLGSIEERLAAIDRKLDAAGRQE